MFSIVHAWNINVKSEIKAWILFRLFTRTHCWLLDHFYSCSGRHWSKYRQMSPSARNLISIPVPRAGKRAEIPMGPDTEDLAAYYPDSSSEDYINQSSDRDGAGPQAREAHASGAVTKDKKFWPKYWTSFVKSPIYWPGSQRPYWRIWSQGPDPLFKAWRGIKQE